MEYIILTKEEISKKMLNIFGYIIVFCIQNYSTAYIHSYSQKTQSYSDVDCCNRVVFT